MWHEKLIVAPREVLKEIKRGNDELVEWADGFPDNFLEPGEEEQLIVQSLIQFYPKEILAKYSSVPWADPLVIACAKHYRLPIVQHESTDANQCKIPAIAKRVNVPCIRLVKFFEDQGWQFSV
jgi:hypothetical protein